MFILYLTWQQGADSKKRSPTLIGQFRQSLDALMKALAACQPYFIRCIKPNDLKQPKVSPHHDFGYRWGLINRRLFLVSMALLLSTVPLLDCMLLIICCLFIHPVAQLALELLLVIVIPFVSQF